MADFRQKFFPQAGQKEWRDWQWQLRHGLRTLVQLQKVFDLSDDETTAIEKHEGLPVAITPYYASLLHRSDANHGLRRTVIPVGAEYVRSPGEAEDPLGEEPHRPVPAIVHRYPDRALFLATGYCSVYCRYCTRSRLVGDATEYKTDMKEWQKAFDYIRAHPEVRDVLVTGGDPLTLSDDKLDFLLKNIRAIPHVEFIRIGTKVPFVLPQRITPALCKILKKYHPLWMSVHVTHPEEITPESKLACTRLADAGIPLGSHTVLLKGVNDNVDTMKSLMHELLKIRVKPYYLFHCDPILGSAHFRTSVEKGVEIIRGLRGHTTGYAVPHYAIDLAGSGGKVTISPDYLSGRHGDQLVVRNYAGETYLYPDQL